MRFDMEDSLWISSWISLKKVTWNQLQIINASLSCSFVQKFPYVFYSHDNSRHVSMTCKKRLFVSLDVFILKDFFEFQMINWKYSVHSCCYDSVYSAFHVMHLKGGPLNMNIIMNRCDVIFKRGQYTATWYCIMNCEWLHNRTPYFIGVQ